MEPPVFKAHPGDHELQAFLDEQAAKARGETTNQPVPNLEKQFMQRLTDVRSKKHCTQSALAHRAGISQPALARIEAGKVSPTLSTLTKLADALGYELTILKKQT